MAWHRHAARFILVATALILLAVAPAGAQDAYCSITSV